MQVLDKHSGHQRSAFSNMQLLACVNGTVQVWVILAFSSGFRRVVWIMPNGEFYKVEQGCA